MGSPPNEPGRRSDESQVDVTISKGFWTAKFEVTQGEWKRIVGAFPDKPPTPNFGEGDDFPMYWINYLEAYDFCTKLTDQAHRSGALPARWIFTLPTEAQWEYACRAGTTTATAFGNELTLGHANFNGEQPITRSTGAGLRRAAKVGSYAENAWGICDMHGNVWEWCHDWYHAQLPGGTDPDLRHRPGVRNGDGTFSRIRRGGAWIEAGHACRSAFRLRYEPPRRSDHIGMRVLAIEF
jgi:formylglycine-generating enzyme required for sulfatase activity